MQHSRWFIGLFFSFMCALALGQAPEKIAPDQAPGKIPLVKVSAVKLPAKEIPGAAAFLDASKPFIARYAYCNAMQLYQSRREVWEPIYRDAGASSADLDVYSGDLVTYIKEFCANGRPPNYWQEALARVEAFDNRVDVAMATSLGIGLQDATQLRISRLLAQLDQYRERCLGAGQAAIAEDQVSVFGSLLPATSAPPGMTLDPKPIAMSLGKCTSGGASGGSGLGSFGRDQKTLSACVADALAQSDSCASPVGDGPTGAVTRREDFGAVCATAGKTEMCRSSEHRVYANGASVEITTSTVTARFKDGSEHTISSQRRRTIGTEQETISDYTTTSYDGVNTSHTGTGDAGADAVRIVSEEAAVRGGMDLETPAGYQAVITHFVTSNGGHQTEIHSRGMVPTSGSTAGTGQHNDCVTVNPGSSQPLGFARTEFSNDGRASPVHAGHFDTWDLVGQCMCTTLGRAGPELAHQSGFNCAPDENTRRLDCLLNPRGPADNIRPECVGYLQADNPGRDTRTALTQWCGHVAQCPPGAALASTSTTGGIMCSCGTNLTSPAGGGGGTPGGARCAAVSCAGGGGPGAAGADLYRECCGGSGEPPVGVSPSSGPPGLPPAPQPEGLPETLKTPLPKQPLLEKPPPKKQPGGLSP